MDAMSRAAKLTVSPTMAYLRRKGGRVVEKKGRRLKKEGRKEVEWSEESEGRKER